MEPTVIAAWIAAGVSLLTLVGTLAAQYVGRRATRITRTSRSNPNVGLLIGEIWDLDLLAEDYAADGRYDFFLTAAPIPFYGAAGAPVNLVAVK